MSRLFEEEYSHMISLGADCRVRYQISLSLYKRSNQDAFDLSSFERALYASSKEVGGSGTFFFDWNISPISGVVTCINEGFRGIFERANLSIAPNGSAQDSKTGILHHHNFSRENGRVTQEIIDQEYEKQKSKVKYLANKFLENLNSDQRTLYVRFGGGQDEAKLVADAIFRHHPHHPFHILIVSAGDGDSRVISSCDNITHYQMNKTISKPIAAQWQGDNDEWGRLLDHIKLGRQAADERDNSR